MEDGKKTKIKVKKTHNQKHIDNMLEECLELDDDYFRSQIINLYQDMM